MSEAATERPTRTAPPNSGGAPGNVFTRKFGPLPGWGWAALAGVGAIGFMWWRNRSGAAAAQAAAAQGTGTDTSAAVGDDVQGQLSTLQTEIQDLQGTESTEAEGSGSGGSTGGGSKKRHRHVSTGKENFNQVAKAAGTSVAHIVSVSRGSGENQANLSKLLEWAAHPHTRRKGVVYYTD